jgi:hypothetical protein
MIGVIATRRFALAAELVLAALRRSVSGQQARLLAPAAISTAEVDVIVAIDPSETIADCLTAWAERGGRKLVLFGGLPERLAERYGIQTVSWPDNLASLARSVPAPTYGFAESQACVRYRESAARFSAAGWQRALERFDFTDEWNNLGYGAIRGDGSIWALSAPLRAPRESELAGIEVAGMAVGSYSGLFDGAASSMLWFNRSVGPIDSFEWRLVEKFLSSWRAGELACQPVLLEVPWGHDAAVTMRLDCDEDVESARALWEAYGDMGVPFSLAVHTANLTDKRNHRLLREVVGTGGSVFSHTATHAPNWGGSYETAFEEATESARWLREVIGRPVDYAVAPFHQSPAYALAALADVGYRGCVGGIIRNDPEFLLARGGVLAGLPEGFIGHSQQCMLHGDCLLATGDPLAVYKNACDRAIETRTLFGYLDHPFSTRYQYGWMDEATRLAAHRQLVVHMRSRAAAPLFLSEAQAMDFLAAKAEWQVTETDDEFTLAAPTAAGSSVHRPTVEYGGREFAAARGSFRR